MQRPLTSISPSLGWTPEGVAGPHGRPFLTFGGKSTPFCTVAAPTYVLIGPAGGFPLAHSPPPNTELVFLLTAILAAVGGHPTDFDEHVSAD